MNLFLYFLRNSYEIISTFQVIVKICENNLYKKIEELLTFLYNFQIRHYSYSSWKSEFSRFQRRVTSDV